MDASLSLHRQVSPDEILVCIHSIAVQGRSRGSRSTLDAPQNLSPNLSCRPMHDREWEQNRDLSTILSRELTDKLTYYTTWLVLDTAITEARI